MWSVHFQSNGIGAFYEGLNMRFIAMGALMEKLLSENAQLNWAQIFKEYFTIGFVEYLSVDLGNGSLAHSKACKEAQLHVL